MISELEKILQLVRANPTEFKRFSGDTQQTSPEARIISISGILERIKLPSNSTIVDIGTGYGYGAILLNAMGYNVLGLEINGDKLKEGMNYWKGLGVDFCETFEVPEAVVTKGKLYFMRRDTRDLSDFPDSSIDMATAFYISGYMTGKNGAFVNVQRVLKPQRNLTITTEGPTILPSFLRAASVKGLSIIQKPKGLRHIETFTIDNPQVYDKNIIIYEKAA